MKSHEQNIPYRQVSRWKTCHHLKQLNDSIYKQNSVTDRNQRQPLHNVILIWDMHLYICAGIKQSAHGRLNDICLNPTSCRTCPAVVNV